ncbi:MAG: twin-arginine translocase subunit TatC [Anaerolineae bacterium]|nr:twin-arginine translocase subunit TatC [Anaerolineae bacterium]
MANEAEMTLFDHIKELRQRLLRVVIVCIVMAGVSAATVVNYAIEWLRKPLNGLQNVELIQTSPTESTIIYFKVALVLGFGLALPYILYQIYSFIAPGLYRQERQIFLTGIPLVMIFFAAGAAFTVEVLLPPSMNVLLNVFVEQNIVNRLSLAEYLSFINTLILWMGLIFQTPLVIYVIARLGFVTPQVLTKGRRMVILLAFVAAAIITPTADPFTMLLVTAPFIVLFEIGILLARLAARQRARQMATLEEELE